MTGVKVTLDGEIFNIADGDLFEAPRNGDPSQLGSVVCQPDRGTFDPRNLNAEVNVETTMGSDTWQGTRDGCTRIDHVYDHRGADGSTQTCLVDNRFQAEVVWGTFREIAARRASGTSMPPSSAVPPTKRCLSF